MLASLLPACGWSHSGNEDSDIGIAMLKGPSAMGMVHMLDSCSRIKIFTEPMQVRKAMLEGSTDFAALPMNIAAILYNLGLEYSLIAVPVSGSLYLAGSDRSINGWSDLRGKKVHIMAKGMTPDLLFRHLLAMNGLEADRDVVLDYNFPTHTDIASAMAAGRVSIGVITEPYLSMVSAKNSAVKPMLDLNDEWAKVHRTSVTETAFMVKNELLRNNPEIVEKIVDNYKESINWVNSHPDSAAVLMVRHGIIPDTVAARKAIPLSHLYFRRAKEHKAEIDAYLRILFEMSPDIVGGRLPDEEFYQ